MGFISIPFALYTETGYSEKKLKEVLGAITGDIIGSRFEFNNHLSKDFELFDPSCRFTDDTVCTVAVADWINQNCEPDFTKNLQLWCQEYQNAGFSPRFLKWVKNPTPYNSFGNGAAMRVSPLAMIDTKKFPGLIEAITLVSHAHPEAVKGATAIVEIIQNIDSAKEIGLKYYPNHIISVSEWQKINTVQGFDATCQGTVPAAISCFLQATSFEDAIRNAISIGGDTDTIASMTGAIAEVYYGVPEKIKRKSLTYLSKEMLLVYERFSEKTTGWKA